MNKIQIGYSVLGALGLIMATLGYLIKFKNMFNLITRFYKRDKRINDAAGFASFIGDKMLILGIIFFISACMIYDNSQPKLCIEIVFLVSVFLVIGIAYRNSRKYIGGKKDE
jgi:Domain of unknown function (DUF3784)